MPVWAGYQRQSKSSAPQKTGSREKLPESKEKNSVKSCALNREIRAHRARQIADVFRSVGVVKGKSCRVEIVLTDFHRVHDQL